MSRSRRAAIVLTLLVCLAPQYSWAPPSGRAQGRSYEYQRWQREIDPRARERLREAFGIESGNERSAIEITGAQVKVPKLRPIREDENQEREQALAFGRELSRDKALRAEYVARHVPKGLRGAVSKLTGLQLLVASSILTYRPRAMDAISGEPLGVQQEVLRLVLAEIPLEFSRYRLAYYDRQGRTGSLRERDFALHLKRGGLRFGDKLLQESALPSEQEIRRKLSAVTAWVRRPSTLVVGVSELRDASRGDVTKAFDVEVAGATHQIKAPRYELLGLENRALRRRFAEAVGELGSERALLVASPDLRISTHELLPGMLSARTFDHTRQFMPQHMENLAHLLQWRPDPQRTRFFNLVPTDTASLSTLGLKGGAKAWKNARVQFADFATRKGFAQTENPTREQLLDSLRNEELDTLVIAAHGDTNAIYLAGGEKITVDDIRNLGPPAKGRRPIVILVSCNTGRTTQRGVTNIAQALLEQGRAAAVLAPTSRIPASEETINFLQTIYDQGKADLRPVLENIQRPWQLVVEKAVGRRRS